MSSAFFEVPTGTIDGVNTTFTVSQAYVPGSVAVFINGVLVRKIDDDGWVETDPTTGTVDLKEAPRGAFKPGDMGEIIQIFYIGAVGSTELEDVITRIEGRVREVDGISALLRESDTIQATIDESEQLTALLRIQDSVSGVVNDLERITAKVRVCS